MPAGHQMTLPDTGGGGVDPFRLFKKLQRLAQILGGLDDNGANLSPPMPPGGTWGSLQRGQGAAAMPHGEKTSPVPTGYGGFGPTGVGKEFDHVTMLGK